MGYAHLAREHLKDLVETQPPVRKETATR